MPCIVSLDENILFDESESGHRGTTSVENKQEYIARSKPSLEGKTIGVTAKKKTSNGRRR